MSLTHTGKAAFQLSSFNILPSSSNALAFVTESFLDSPLKQRTIFEGKILDIASDSIGSSTSGLYLGGGMYCFTLGSLFLPFPFPFP
jgi:hypothetical protein